MVELTLTNEQAQLVAKACEFYARVKMGQFEEITWNLLDVRKMEGYSYCNKREVAEHYLLEARKIIYPDLHGIGHSYGIGKFEDADKAYDVYQVIQFALGSNKEPWSYHALPKCKLI